MGGGAILHDDKEADDWYRRMRHDGRTPFTSPKDDEIKMIGEHCYMFPATAAEGIQKLEIYRKTEHADLMDGQDEYADCSKVLL